MISYSQLGQDAWVLKQTKLKDEGYFVDFGATDGKSINNTYLLEKAFGWKGIVCEPNPKYHKQLFLNRDCHISTLCVAPRSGEIVSFLDVEETELSGMQSYAFQDEHSEKRKKSKKINVNTISLMDLLQTYEAPDRIDYLNIDTEGSEYDILSSFDFDAYNISLITVEHNYMPNRDKIYSLLLGAGYARIDMEQSKWDDWYTKL